MNENVSAKDRGRNFSLSHDVLYFTHNETDFGNPLWKEASRRALVVRLSPFDDVAESRPHLFLFDEIRRELPEAYIDFAFFPKQRDIPILGKAGLPWLCGIASGRGAGDFDILVVSNAFTLELVNLMPALAGSGIPPRRSDRATGALPYILLGGSNALASGALLDIREGKIADSVPDGFFFGEGEVIAGKLVADILASRNDDEYFKLARVHAGFYPAGYEGSVVQASFRGSAPGIQSYPVLAGGYADTVRMDISSGCPSFCTFCFESWERKPYREYSLSSLSSLARKLKTLSGAETIELSSYNFNTHSDITGLISSAAKVFKQVNFMSQRVDILAEHPELVEDRKSVV